MEKLPKKSIQFYHKLLIHVKSKTVTTIINIRQRFSIFRHIQDFRSNING